MTLEVPDALSFSADVPPHWHAQVRSQLLAHENVWAALEVDLDTRLHFVKGLVLATNQRLLSYSPEDAQWRSWEYRSGLVLQHHDHAGVGHLELLDASGLLFHWRFTLGQNLHALRLVDQFLAHNESAHSGHALAPVLKSVCPSCKAPLEADAEECPV